MQRLRVVIQLLCLQLHGRLQACQCLDQQSLASRRILMLQRVQGGLQRRAALQDEQFQVKHTRRHDVLLVQTGGPALEVVWE